MTVFGCRVNEFKREEGKLFLCERKQLLLLLTARWNLLVQLQDKVSELFGITRTSTELKP